MHERSLPASPNWYCSRCSDVSSGGLLGVGAKNIIYLIEASASSCELVGHKDLVSGFSFCQHAGQSHICVSSSNDGSVRFWDSDNKALIRENAAHQTPVAAVHWSPVDKNLVVSGDEKGIVVCHWYHTGDTTSFFPEPRTIFCLTCSPHTWSTVAVGKKSNTSILKKNEKGCYLASGSKDQTVRIWSSAKGKGVMTLKLPYVKKRGSAVDPGVKERLWLHVHWPKGRPTQLVSSCFSGELVMWDLTRTGKQRWTLFGTSSEGQNHSRIIFNLSSVHLQDDRELLISTSMDREIKCWDLASLDCCWTLPTLGGFVYALTFSPVGAGCLALGVGDNMIRVWNTLTTQNQYDTRSFWQGIKSKVTALAWHPKKEGSLSFGTDDGKVGIYDVFSNKPPQISSSYHRKTVYTLAWGPPVPPMSFGAAGGKPSCCLYSCAGEGVILQHDPTKLSGEASDIDKLIRDTNDIKHKLSPHTDLSWKPDGKVVAIGNEDGCIDVYQAPSLKLLCSIQQHHKIINTLRWHHDHSSLPELHCLLASGSSNATVFIHDLHSVIENPPESPVVLTEPYRRLCGHTAKITGMAWSPHHDARLVTVSYDGTAQVWDVLQEEALSNYRGHVGYLLCVDWSPVDPDVIWTGGKDFTLQEWRVSKQEFTKPPKATFEMQRKSSAVIKSKDKPGACFNFINQLQLNVFLKLGLCMFFFYVTVWVCPCVLDLNLLKKKKPRSMLPVSTSMDHRPKEDLLQDCINLASVKYSNGETESAMETFGTVCLHLVRRCLTQLSLMVEKEGHVEAGHYDSVVYLRLWSGDLEGALQLATEKGELSDHLLSVAPMAGFEVWSRTVEAFVKQLCLQEQYLKAASHLLSINKLYEAVDLLCVLYVREAIALVKARLPADEPVLTELYTCWAATLEKDGHFSAAAKCYLAAGASFDAAKVIARKNDVSSLRTAANLARISGEVALAQSLALRCAKDLAAALDWVKAQEVLSPQESLLVHRLHLGVAELLAAMLADSQVSSQPCVSSHPWASRGERHVSIQDRVRDVWERQFGVSQKSAGHRGAGALLQELKSVESPTPTANIPLRQVQRPFFGVYTVCFQIYVAVTGAIVPFIHTLFFFHSSGDVSVCSRKHPKTLHHTETEAKAAADSLQAFVHYQHLYEHWWSNAIQIQNGCSRSAVDSSPGDEVKDKVVNGGVSEEGVCPATRLDKLDFDASLLLSEQHAACQATQRSVIEIQERLAAMVLQHSRAQGPQLDSGEKEPDTPTQISNSQGSADTECPAVVSHPEQFDDCPFKRLYFLSLRPEDQETLLSLSSKMSEHQKRLADLPDTIKVQLHTQHIQYEIIGGGAASS
uniref:Gem (nuclear organelle) associated protein 5 n=1 Tax=Dicentrarchus labrax TaxID=13489 RepID=A0A8C4H2J4_DICLA